MINTPKVTICTTNVKSHWPPLHCIQCKRLKLIALNPMNTREHLCVTVMVKYANFYC